MPVDHVVVTTTADSADAAGVLAAAAVEASLAACAQIVGPITSVYHWEGAVQTETEWRVECKTARDRAAALVELFEARHSYDVPEIIVTPIEGGGADYLEWVTLETR
ncbi:divalent-cation tolerance protein CutA [Amycolatopsis samaneae]|uniref:Divalent-cation tolerance protein CutA n=1 Tax=Amycolatopsis samaneae TaxID=664691 RepID=A0ABW5GG02_9PSEU